MHADDDSIRECLLSDMTEAEEELRAGEADLQLNVEEIEQSMANIQQLITFHTTVQYPQQQYSGGTQSSSVAVAAPPTVHDSDSTGDEAPTYVQVYIYIEELEPLLVCSSIVGALPTVWSATDSDDAAEHTQTQHQQPTRQADTTSTAERSPSPTHNSSAVSAGSSPSMQMGRRLSSIAQVFRKLDEREIVRADGDSGYGSTHNRVTAAFDSNNIIHLFHHPAATQQLTGAHSATLAAVTQAAVTQAATDIGPSVAALDSITDAVTVDESVTVLEQEELLKPRRSIHVNVKAPENFNPASITALHNMNTLPSNSQSQPAPLAALLALPDQKQKSLQLHISDVALKLRSSIFNSTFLGVVSAATGTSSDMQRVSYAAALPTFHPVVLAVFIAMRCVVQLIDHMWSSFNLSLSDPFLSYREFQLHHSLQYKCITHEFNNKVNIDVAKQDWNAFSSAKLTEGQTRQVVNMSKQEFALFCFHTVDLWYKQSTSHMNLICSAVSCARSTC